VADGIIAGTTVADTKKQYSNTGSAVYGTGKNVTPADLGFSGDVTELWMRFDYYVHSTENNIKIMFYFDNAQGYSYIGLYGIRVRYNVNGNSFGSVNTALYNQPINKVVFHISKTALQIYINDVTAFSKIDTNNGSKITGMSFLSEKNIDSTTANNNMFSNVIIADYDCSNETLELNGTPISETFDLKRTVSGILSSTFDLSRKLSNRDTETFDLLRIITDKQIVAEPFDLLRKTSNIESVKFDLLRTVLSSQIHCTLDYDTKRSVYRTVSEHYDTKRSVYRTVSEHYDTKRTIPYSLDHLRIQSVTLNLQENTLTDHMSFAIAGELHPFDAMRGTFLDYSYKFTIDSTSQQELIQTCNSMYDFDDILTRYYKFKCDIVPAYDIYASLYARRIAYALGLHPVCSFDDFIPENNYNNTNVTYSTLISSIFSWTTKLPRRQINIFMRGNKLYFLQRGKEPNTVDITAIPHNRPTIKREIVRTIDRINIPPQGIYGRANFYVDPKFFNENLPASDGDKHYSNGKIQRSGGANVGKQTTTNPDGSTMTIEYKYDSKNRVIEKDVTNPDNSSIQIEYEYSDTSGGSFLVKQTETKTDKNGKSEATVTRYDPVGNGYVSASQADEDGNYVGGSLSKGGGNGDVDKTEMQSAQTALGAGWDDVGDDAAGNKAEIGWPVSDEVTWWRILSEICWIYHSIKEQVSVDIQCKVVDSVPEYTHIIDFTDKIVLDGNTYYLQSNTVRRDSRSLTQSLQLVRWYGGGTVSDKSNFVVNKMHSGV
jgi:hypothetical protein